MILLVTANNFHHNKPHGTCSVYPMTIPLLEPHSNQQLTDDSWYAYWACSTKLDWNAHLLIRQLVPK